ncbi:hypothetical protein ACFO3O_06135 [Dokdonia ponticola]|uniref:Uncharacterized protein n=1 Tax=Dokdonia ponticola TaxID=2041041 RepID=A0ABV9HTG8_9FLAO
MKVTIIIGIVIVVLYYIGKNKQKNESEKKSSLSNKPSLKSNPPFLSKLSTIKFPDRINAIDWHNQKIQQGLKTGDIDLANLSYAKLYESIRQENVNDNGEFKDILEVINQEYKEFREYFQVEYPEQFLPPEEQKKKKEKEFEKIKEFPVYLETGNYIELPKQILKYVDIVKPISEWHKIGIKPKKGKYGKWKAIKRSERYFGFYDAKLNKKEHKISLETGKRITKKPYFIKALNEQGIPLTDFVAYGEDLEYFIKAVDFFDNQEFENAQKEIDKALEIKRNEDYKELKIDIEIKLNNEQVVDEEFNKYKFDIDSAIHTGKFNDWLKVLINNNKYDKVIHFINQANKTLEKLISGEIEPKIYGKQSSDYYEYKKKQFNRNLIYIFDSKSSELEKSENSIKLLELFLNLYSKEDFRPIEKIADQFGAWNLKKRATELYQECLKIIGNDNKPRIKSRIEKKMETNK